MLGNSDQLAFEFSLTITPEAWAKLGPRDRVRLAQLVRQVNPELVHELELKAAQLLREAALGLPPQNPVERAFMERAYSAKSDVEPIDRSGSDVQPA